MALRDKSKDVVEAGTLAVTRASGFAAGVVVIATSIDPVFDAVFDEQEPTPGLKATIIVAAILAWALIAAVDVAARSYATAQARLAARPVIGTAPAGMRVTRTDGRDEHGYLVAAVRSRQGADGPEFLIVKQGHAAEWVSAGDVEAS